MSVLPGATNTTIHNGIFNAVSTTVANVGAQNDIVNLLHLHSAPAGLLDAKERFDAPKCDEGTRTSMILGMKKFVQDGDAASSPALYWLHGPAGVGKSALAQSLSLSLKSEGDHAASFFFSRTSPGRNNGNQLIVTLAYQLATNFPALQRFISKVVKKHPAILTASNAVQMQSLIIDPINKWQKRYKWSIRRWVHKIFNVRPHPRLILVDGLDECSDPEVQGDLLLCIALAVRQLSIPLRFVIASRPDSHILATFELDPVFQGLNGVKVTKQNLGEDEDADEQITTFLLNEFAEIRRVHPIRNFLPEPWPRPDQINQLVSKSSKGFIYPASVIRYVKMPNSRPDKCLERILGLSAIPTSDKPYEPLDALYRHIFESVPEVNKPSIRDIFHFLVIPTIWDGAMTPSTIERNFNYMAGHVQHVLSDLLCLVTFDCDSPIKVLHASLPDFLLDRSRSGPLYIDVGDAHATIAASYLLDICHSDELPRHDFLMHMTQANLSNPLIRCRILQLDLVSWYKQEVPATQFLHTDSLSPHTDSRFVYIDLKSLLDVSFPAGILGEAQKSLESPPETIARTLAFMVAYLLVVLIEDGPKQYIKAQIANIKAYVLQICPFVSSVHALHELIPITIPLFRQWSSTIYNEYIRYIFSVSVSPSQYQIRQDIFELHFLMLVPFCRVNITLALRLKGLALRLKRKNEKNKALKRINWEDIVRGQVESNYEVASRSVHS